MTYAEIYARRKALGMEHLSIEEFSRLYGNNPEFEAGRTGGVVGQALKAASAGVDRFFSATGLPEASYEFFRHLPTVATLGYADPNEKLGQAAMSLPRGIATMATMPFGVPGLVAGAGAMGVDTYEKTNSAGAGVVGGAMGLATPFAGRVGGGLAAGVGTKVAPRLFSPATTQAVASGATNAVAGGVFQSAATRALQFAGQQAGYTGYGALTQGVTGGIAAPDGQGWSAFKDAFTPENLAISAVTSLPFGVNDVMQLRAQGQMVKDYATAQRYDALRTAERQRAEAPVNAARDAIRAEVAKQTMALPWRGSDTNVKAGRQAVYEAQVRNETIADVNRATVRDGMFHFGYDATGQPVYRPTEHPGFAAFQEAAFGAKASSEMGKPGYRVTDKEASNRYLKTGGWKLHLAVKPENYAEVDTWLAKNHKGQYKLLTGGDAGESDFTIYIGDKKTANGMADKLNAQLGHLLETRVAGTDTHFNEKVTGRFDVQRTGNVRDVPWVFYGEKGIPFDEDAAAIVYGQTGEERRRRVELNLGRIDKELRSKYGEFYTGQVKAPLTVAEAFQRAMREQAYETGLLRSVSRQAPPEVQAKLVEAARTTPVEERVMSPDVQVKTAALLETTNTAPDTVVERVTELTNKGEDPAVALREQLNALEQQHLVTQLQREADAAVAAKDKKEPSAKDVAKAEDATRTFDTIYRTFTKDERVKAKFDESFALARDSNQDDPNGMIQRVVLKWAQESPVKDAESLIEALRGNDGFLTDKAVNHSSARSLSKIDSEGRPVFQYGNVLKFKTSEEAAAFIEKHKDDKTSWSWVHEKNVKEPYYKIVVKDYFDTAIGGNVDTLLLDAVAADGEVVATDSPIHVMLKAAKASKQLSEKDAARVAQRANSDKLAVRRFMAKVDEDVLHELGRGLDDEERIADGKERLSLLLEIRAADKAEKPALMETFRGLFDNKKAEVNAFLETPLVKSLLAAWDVKRGAVTADANTLVHTSKVPYTRFDESQGQLGLHLAKGDALYSGDKKTTPHVTVFKPAFKKTLRLRDFGGWTWDDIGQQLLESGVITQKQHAAFSEKPPSNAELKKLIVAKGYDSIVYLNRREGHGVEIDEDTWADVGFGGSDEEFLKIAPKAQDSFIALTPDSVVKADANSVKKMLSLVPSSADLQAGGGFYYNVGRFENGRIGKHVLPKSGRVSEAQFAKVGRGDDRPLQKNEIELYRALVPEAFDGQNVDVPVLLDGLRRAVPTVEVKTLQQNSRDSYTTGQAQHELETAGYVVSWDNGGVYVTKQGAHVGIGDFSSPQLVRAYRTLMAAQEGGRGETMYASVAPRADMPGYVEGLVRVPTKGKPKAMTGGDDAFDIRPSWQIAEDNARDARQNVKYRGPHFGAEDTNVIGFFRGYMETLPDGTKAFHVIEVQSDWGQKVRKYQEEQKSLAALTERERVLRGRSIETYGGEKSHPLLAVYEELALKAAIKHARDNGATRLVLSDAETAMMTEGHDTHLMYQLLDGDGAPVGSPQRSERDAFNLATVKRQDAQNGPYTVKQVTTQEGGMRLHYDTTLPSALRKITGDKGQRVELGQHVKGGDVGSPVFRNPDGTPKANITGTVYDISGVAIAERGRGPAFGGELRPDYVGQRRTLSELLRTVGLDDRWLDDTARLVSLYDNHDVAFAELLGATDAAGLFTVQRDGQKLVWLSQQNNPRRSLFALTHELNGHALWQAKREGRLDAETTHRLSQWEQLVADTSPETRRVMLQELWRHLPKEFRKDAALKKLVDTTAADAEEFHANINAIASLNLVHSSKSVWRDLLTYLPKPLADLLVVMARTSRRVLESINGYLFTREHGFNTGAVNAKARKDLSDYIDTLYGVLKVDRERSDAAAKALRMGLLTDSEARFTAGQNPDYWVAGNKDEQAVIQAMGLVREDDPAKTSLLPEGSMGFTRMFGPMAAWAVKYPQLRRLLNTATRSEARAALMEKHVLEPLGFERDGFKIKARDRETNPLLRVESDIKLAEKRDAIIARANVTNKTVEQLFAEKDTAVMSAVAGLDKQKLADLRGAFAQHEAANKAQNAYMRDLSYERLVYITGEALLNKNPEMSLATAESLAKELIAAQRQGQTFAGTEETARGLVPFVKAAASRIEETAAFFEARPYFVSYRRFGEFSASVKFSDGRAQVAKSFDTQAARDEWLRQYEGDPRATTKLHVKKFRTKGDLGNEALDILREIETRNLDALTSALVVNGMDADTAKTLVGRFSTHGEVARELAAQKLPSTAPRRRFVAGYEELNTTQQQVQYLQMLAHGISKGTHTAEFNMLMASPEARAIPDRETLQKAFDQWKNPDSEATKAVRKASYFMYMMLHPVNMFQDAIQPLVGQLPSWMINDGVGVVEAHKMISTAMKDRARPKNLSADEQRMLKWFKDSNQGLASYSDEANNEALQLHNLHAIANGRKTAGMGDWLRQKSSSALLHVKQFHRHATDYGMESAMLAAYRWQRGKGLTHDNAVAAAFDFVMPAMGAQGKGGRAQGIWDAGVLKPVTASVTALQSFAMNQLFTAKGTFERAIGRVPGLTAKQRVESGKAFAATLALMAVTGGIMGVVGVAPTLAIIDKVFDVNSREALADMLRGDDDDEFDDVVQQVAMHGALSFSGGPDVGSKFASQGFLGFNGYDGWSLESMAGVGYDLVKRVFTLPERLQNEGAGALTSLAPQPFKRGLDAWKDDWEFRRKDGSLIDESTPYEKSIYAIFGLKPTRIANLQERDSWQRLDAQNDAAAREAFVNEMMSLMDEGDFGAVRNATIQRAATREGERPDMIAQTLAAQYAERLYGRMASRRAGYNPTLGRTTPADSMSEVQRLQVEDAIRRQLNMGFATSPQQLQRAREVDAIRALNPTMSVRSARDWVERKYGRGQDAAMRGATYQYRR